jgi:hypothetical protein
MPAHTEGAHADEVEVMVRDPDGRQIMTLAPEHVQIEYAGDGVNVETLASFVAEKPGGYTVEVETARPIALGSPAMFEGGSELSLEVLPIAAGVAGLALCTLGIWGGPFRVPTSGT